MAQLGSLIVTGDARFLNTIYANISGTAANVRGTVAVANGGTGATSAAAARTNLGIGNVGTLSYGSSTSTYLRNDGTWQTPPNTDTKMSKKRYTITATSWSNSADSNGYFTYTVTLASPTLATAYPPNVYIAGSTDSTFPTDTEKEQYALLEQCNHTATNSLTLYAKTKPTSNFYVYIEGQST